MDIWPLLTQKSSFTLLIAPPAWGKTRLIFNLYQNKRKPFIFVSPLRALAEEFFLAGGEFKKLTFIDSRNKREKILQDFFEEKIDFLILTPEMLSYDALAFIDTMQEKPLFIFDEFHLYYLWGESFRPWIWEVVMGVSCLSCPILGLTATFNDELKKKWPVDFRNTRDNLFLIDLGNQTFKNWPQKIHYYPFFLKKQFNRYFIQTLLNNEDECFLFFCRYRSEVDRWMDFCYRYKILALGCKGGEVVEFTKQLKKISRPRCIFATSALSHGVNLPSLIKVFIGYKTNDLDFWIQMASRGGRRGENFQVHSFDRFFMKISHCILSSVKVFFRDLFF